MMANQSATGKGSSTSSVWAARAPELAAWTLERLANRLDAWGEYRPEGEIGKRVTLRDGTPWTLGAQKTRKGELTLTRVVRHFRARGRADIIGLHTADADNQSKGGAHDIDHHGAESTAPECDAPLR
jgi:hypothetical protein